MSDDPEYARIGQLADQVVALLDAADATYVDYLHIASHLTHFALQQFSFADRRRVMEQYFACVAAGVNVGVATGLS